MKNTSIKLTETEKTIISNGFYSNILELFKSAEPFSIVINNNNDWDFDLPERLAKAPAFILSLNSGTDASYINDNAELVLVAQFDDEEFTKTLVNADIHSIGNVDNKMYLEKPFVEKHPPKKFVVTDDKQNEPNPEKVQNSMNAFMKHNPDLIKEIKN